MNIRTDFSSDKKTPKPVPGSYEWWYFDAISDNGYSIVVIFYEGNPFSRRYIQSLSENRGETASEFPAISVSVYYENRPVFYSFREVLPAQSFFSDEHPEGQVSGSRFLGRREGDRRLYELHLDEQLPNGDTLQADLLFSSSVIPDDFESRGDNSRHTWNLVQPKCDVTGELHIEGYENVYTRFSGKGYHDHNTGMEPMKQSFDEWYWGRYHFDGYTLIYYLMNQKGVWDRKAWLIGDDGQTESLPDITLKEKGASLFGLQAARSVSFQNDRLKAFLQLDEVLDSGPFYQRYRGRMLLHNGENRVEAVRGISEYISPSRIYSRWFWPLVNMRINYPGKDHWVQKSPVLYRWTW